jgi:hypothetical protein
VRRTGRCEPAPAWRPEKASTAPTEAFKRSVSVKDFDRHARQRIEIEQRIVFWVPTIAEHCHAAGSVVSARAKPRK